MVNSNSQQTSSASTNQPERISQLGQWMRENPRGTIIVNDWKAVMR